MIQLNRRINQGDLNFFQFFEEKKGTLVGVRAQGIRTELPLPQERECVVQTVGVGRREALWSAAAGREREEGCLACRRLAVEVASMHGDGD